MTGGAKSASVIAGPASGLGASRRISRTGSESRSTTSPVPRCAGAAAVMPKKGSPANSSASGTATKETGLNRCSTAKASAVARVSLAMTATRTTGPSPTQSQARSSTG